MRQGLDPRLFLPVMGSKLTFSLVCLPDKQACFSNMNLHAIFIFLLKTQSNLTWGRRIPPDSLPLTLPLMTVTPSSRVLGHSLDGTGGHTGSGIELPGGFLPPPLIPSMTWVSRFLDTVLSSVKWGELKHPSHVDMEYVSGLGPIVLKKLYPLLGRVSTPAHSAPKDYNM